MVNSPKQATHCFYFCWCADLLDISGHVIWPRFQNVANYRDWKNQNGLWGFIYDWDDWNRDTVIQWQCPHSDLFVAPSCTVVTLVPVCLITAIICLVPATVDVFSTFCYNDGTQTHRMKTITSPFFFAAANKQRYSSVSKNILNRLFQSALIKNSGYANLWHAKYCSPLNVLLFKLKRFSANVTAQW